MSATVRLQIEGRTKLASDKKAMATITESLQPDEQVLDTIHAAYIVSTTNSENTIGTLALTNKRLIFSGQSASSASSIHRHCTW